MSGAIAVTYYTLRELMRRKLLYFLVGGGVLLVIIAAAVVPAYKALVPGAPVPPDTAAFILGLSYPVLAFFAWVSAIAISLTLISTDIDSGSVVSIFAKPVPRLAYAAGKVGAAVVAMLAIILVMGIGAQVLLLVYGGGHEVAMLEIFGLVALNTLTQMLVILILSVLMNNVVAALLGIVVIQAGKVLGGALTFVDYLVQQGIHNTWVSAANVVLDFLYWTLPRYLELDLNSEIGAGVGAAQGSQGSASGAVPLAHYVGVTDLVYWLAYAAILFGLLYWVLRKREV